MAKIKLTDALLRRLDSRNGERLQLYDEVVPGLVLRVGPTGNKSFSLLYWSLKERRRKRFTIGPYPAISLAEARRKAGAARDAVAAGRDVGKEKQEKRRAPTFGDLAQEYIEKRVPELKSGREEKYRIEKYLLPALKWKKAGEVDRRDAVNLLDDFEARGKVVMRNHIQGLMSRLYSFGAQRGIVRPADNPVLGLRPKPTTPRAIILEDKEIARFWRRIESGPVSMTIALALKFILLTGQRPGEVAGMEKEEVEGDLWRIPAEKYKTKREHEIPLGPMALEILERAKRLSEDSAFFFAGRKWGESIRRGALALALRRSLKYLEFASAARPHDLRRTMRSKLAELSVQAHIAERVLGHSQRGMIAVYDLHSYLPEKRAALLVWEERLREILRKAEERDSAVLVPLSRVGAR